MDDHTQSKFAATVAAHEAIITVLLGALLSKASPEQREQMESVLVSQPTPGGSVNLTDDLDTADQVAGLMVDYGDVVRRIFARSVGTLK